MKNVTMLVAAILAMAAFALLRDVLLLPIGNDTGWLIHAAGRVLGGEALYTGLMETNPPLIIWLNMIPAWLAPLFHIEPETMLIWCAVLLNLISLACCYRVMRRQHWWNGRPALPAVLVLYAAYALFLLSGLLTAQRELLMIALVLPYLLWSLENRHCEESSDEAIQQNKPLFHWIASLPLVVRNDGISIAIVLLAAIGFALKPFFIVLWVFNEVLIASERNDWRSLFALHNWLIGGCMLLYLAAIFLFNPAYISHIIPAAFATYFAFDVGWQTIFQGIAIISAPVLILFLLASPHDALRRVIFRSLIWLAATACFMLLQRKNWLNHVYPMVFMAGFAITLIVVHLSQRWQQQRLEMPRPQFIAFCCSLGLFIGCAVVAVNLIAPEIKTPSVFQARLKTAIQQHAKGESVYPLSFNMDAAFPTINAADVVYQGSFQQLWPLPGIIVRESEGHGAEVAWVKAWMLDRLVNDFTDHPPKLVWVDDNAGMKAINGYEVSPEQIDIVQQLSEDARFAKLWLSYKKIGEVVDDPKPPAEGAKKQEPNRYSLYLRDESR